MMEAKIQQAIKQARQEKPGIILSSEDIYNAIFKAGIEHGLVVAKKNYLLGRTHGVRGVVEWVEQFKFEYTGSDGLGYTKYPFNCDNWEDKKKEWGL